MNRKIDEEKLRQNRKVLEDEAAARERRIKIRRAQKQKAEAAKKAKAQSRKLKLITIGSALIAVGLFLLIWFSGDLLDLLFKSAN